MVDKPYYLQNFERLCDHARRHHGALLTAGEWRTLDAFAALPQPSQLLLVRMLTRKGPWFRSDRLAYAEVGDTRAAAAPLVAQGFVYRNEPLQALALLALLREDESRALAQACGLPMRGGLAARLPALAARLPPDALAAWTAQRFDWYRVATGGWIDTLMLLFFGNRRQDLSTFVVAELGHVRYEAVAPEALRVFATREDFQQFRQLLALRAEAGAAVARDDTSAMLRAAAGLCAAPDHRLLPARRDRTLVRLAEAFERRGQRDIALAICRHARGPEADRRQALLQARIERERGAEATPTAGAATTVTRRPRTLSFRPVEQVLEIPWHAGRVEACTLDWLLAQGYRGAHFENAFATSVFGLACWDIVFSAVPGAFFNPYQVAPADLHDSAFHARRADAFAQRFAEIREGRWRQRAQQHAQAKRGIANPFVDWWAVDTPLFHDLCDGLHDAAVAALCQRIAQDPRGACSGFPDLSLRHGDSPTRFCEVKSPNDQLSSRQREWMQLLQDHGHAAWVARICTPPVPPPDDGSTAPAAPADWADGNGHA